MNHHFKIALASFVLAALCLLLANCGTPQPVMTFCPIDGGFCKNMEFVWAGGKVVGRSYQCENCGRWWFVDNAGKMAATNYTVHL